MYLLIFQGITGPNTRDRSKNEVSLAEKKSSTPFSQLLYGLLFVLSQVLDV